MTEIETKPVMRPEDFRLIREFVAETFGLVLDESKESYLAARLAPRIAALKLSTFTEYYYHLKFSPDCAAERLKFISIITNNETYFFREEAQLKVFSDIVLPRFKESKRKSDDRRMRIVSAGCSTGEEVYTLAMLILESGSFIWDWDVKITGVDVDPQTIQTAMKGTYSGRSFHAMPEYFMERYFNKCEQGLQVRDVVRKMTEFVQGNLLTLDQVLTEHDADIIFCRNVLIYFNDDTIKRIVENFQKVMAADGFLFLGHSESLTRITTDFLPMRFPGAIVYRLREAGLPYGI